MVVVSPGPSVVVETGSPGTVVLVVPMVVAVVVVAVVVVGIGTMLLIVSVYTGDWSYALDVMRADERGVARAHIIGDEPERMAAAALLVLDQMGAA